MDIEEFSVFKHEVDEELDDIAVELAEARRSIVVLWDYLSLHDKKFSEFFEANKDRY